MNSEEQISFRLVVDDRVVVSEIRPSDKPAFVQYLNDEDLYKTTLRIPSPYTEADAEKFIGITAEATSKHGNPVHFAIRDESEMAIGGISFDGLIYGHRAEIGYWLAKPFWGRGIMTAVVGALCDFAVAEWKLVRITAHVFVGNDASSKVLIKNGFQLEGRMQKHHQKNGEFIDSMLYALVK